MIYNDKMKLYLQLVQKQQQPGSAFSNKVQLSSLDDSVSFSTKSENYYSKKEREIRNFFNDVCRQKGFDSKLIILDRKRGLSGCTDLVTGNIVLDKRFLYHGLSLKHAEVAIIHELKHIEQNSIIARQEGGIETLNRLFIEYCLKSLSEKQKEQLLVAQNQENAEFISDDGTVSKDKGSLLIKALLAIVKNPDISKYDLPMIIDVDFYSKVRQKKGPLNKEECVKAKEYEDAMFKFVRNSDKYTILDWLNPFSDYWRLYRANPLEKEAYAAGKEYKNRT